MRQHPRKGAASTAGFLLAIRPLRPAGCHQQAERRAAAGQVDLGFLGGDRGQRRNSILVEIIDPLSATA